MTYIKKDIKKLIGIMDNKFTVDKNLKIWVRNNISLNHNLIIKSKNGCFCTNCKKIFYSNVNINDYICCPKCKNKFLVKSIKLKKYIFKEDFRVLEYIDDYFIMRGFEILSYYENKQFKHSITEYQRLVISKEKTYLLLSNKFKIFLSSISINHIDKQTSWRLYNNYYYSNWYWAGGLIYFNNLNKDIINTNYYYFDLVNTLKNYKDNIVFLLMKILKNPISYELLIKLNLINLAYDCDKFMVKGSFEKRFGVPKDYLPFMIKYNINYQELNVLRKIKRKNIKIIRKLCCLNNFDILNDNLNIIKALDNGLNKYNEDIYKDYLEFAKKLKLNMKDKKILYPNNILEAHDKLLKQIENFENKEMIINIKNRYEELKNNIYKNDKYIIYPVKSYTDLINESKNQNNCVRTYNFKYANKEVDLYFMRLLSNINKSLVTIEVRNNIVVQSKIKNNQNPTKEQLVFIKKWENEILKRINST